MITGLIIIMTDQQDIRELLENLGSKVSTLAEENRVCKNRDDAGRMLISLLGAYISKDDWINLYQSTDDPYIKKLMIEWGSHLFPKDFL
ncbi:uncharacterized protein METZ01_LOCUS134394 [marine metagenome]|uniref:Uncharacterized protein n=1 Tax=marine metagenome TaxID=408172 RepID=A0A381YX70_9ZZZZ